MPAASPKSVWHRAAQQQPAYGGGQDDQWEGDGEEIQGHEAKHREGDEDGVVEGAPADPDDRLHHDRYHDRLYPVEEAIDRGHVVMGYRQVGEQEQNEDRRDHEEGASHDAAQRTVQPPAYVSGDLLRLRPRQQHAEVERP